MWVIVGLGNPGRQYANTRHNIGFMVIDELRKAFSTSPLQSYPLFHLVPANIHAQSVLLITPQTYMNRSGLAVQDTLQRDDASTDQLVVIYDDLDLDAGRLRIRQHGGHGGHGGHKGLHSIIESLRTDKFVRVRVGIGHPHRKTDSSPLPAQDSVVDYVLQPFEADEQPKINEAIHRAADAIALIVDNRIETAMNTYNRG